jgi:isoleucyl-tRNA synthetase
MTNYKDTLNLPNTDFPMRANLSQREPEMVQRWLDDDVYEQMIERRRQEGAPRYILHDGPPYANGRIHIGHFLNKSLKDFVVKYKNMSGHLAEYVPGWDCHGLPIEHKVDKKLGPKRHEMSAVQIRQECREYAAKYVDVQREDFKRSMVFGDWEDPYLTMSNEYEATTVRQLGEFFEEGIVYQGLKPVHWDWYSQTALAEAEVEYDAHTTEHVYVKFPFELPPELAEHADGRDAFVVIWTTTPWTLPANLAIALHPDLDYVLVENGDEVYVVAEGLRERFLEDCRLENTEVLHTFEGRTLVGELGEGKGLAAQHPFADRGSVLLPADYVTLDQGTGCVHTAPGHGQEDFELGQHFGLDVLCPVDNRGRFMEELVPEWGGMHVFEANPEIVKHLDEIGALLNAVGDKVTIERYPHGWRSKKPVIFRATTQWFIAMEPESAGTPDGLQLRQRALEEIEKVQWVPDWGQDRIVGMVEGRPDWCISRQRTWGCPITAMSCSACGEVLANAEITYHVADLIAEHGADVWFERDATDLVPEGTTCPGCGAGPERFDKETDILDVWFDSGTSWAAVLEEKLGWGSVADLYLEGSDQHRGWFQSSLLCGVGTRGQSPYRTCLTHGFVTDEDGHKYSKSSANFEPIETQLNKYGAEIMRWWVAAVDYRGDVTLGQEILKRVTDAYRKVRNTFRFLLGNLSNFDPDQHLVPFDELEEIDRWLLHRVSETLDRTKSAYDSFQFHQIFHAVVQLCTVDLSNVHLDVSKDRLYCEATDSPARRSGQTAYWLTLHAVARALAPILSFTCEEVWDFLPLRDEDPDSVFLCDFPEGWETWLDEGLAAKWSRLLDARADVQKALEDVRVPRKQKKPGQIGSSQEAFVTVTASGATLELLREYEDDLAMLFIVSDAELVEGDVPDDQTVAAKVVPADGQKCPRCWNYWIESGSDDEVCSRCAEVIEQMTS